MRMMGMGWFLAWRYIRARNGDRFISLTSWLAVIGMVLGVATLILVSALMNGIQQEMRHQLLGVGGHISVSSTQRGLQHYDALAMQLKTIAGVKTATPKIRGQVMLSANGYASGAQVMAIADVALKSHIMFNERLQAGSIAATIEKQGVLLGVGLARQLGVGVGDAVTLISPTGHASIAGIVPRLKSYPVTGIFKLGMHAYDSSLLVMAFTPAQRFFKLRQLDAVSEIEVMLVDSDETKLLTNVIRQKLSANAQVTNWQSQNASVFAALRVQRNVMMIILTMIVLVAAFNIVASLVMMVKEKRKDIAILRTIGLSRYQVMRIFMYTGFIISLVGVFSGVAIGVVLAQNIEALRLFLEHLTGQSLLPENIYFLSSLPTKLELSQVLYIMGFSLIISLLAALYPALKAANMHPVEALRNE
jgi:lipoprotein-releasing system permease protein